MRLKSSIWVSAWLRRVQGEGAFAAVRKRGRPKKRAPFFIKLSLLDGTAQLYAPAAQDCLATSRPIERSFHAGVSDGGSRAGG